MLEFNLPDMSCGLTSRSLNFGRKVERVVQQHLGGADVHLNGWQAREVAIHR